MFHSPTGVVRLAMTLFALLGTAAYAQNGPLPLWTRCDNPYNSPTIHSANAVITTVDSCFVVVGGVGLSPEMPVGGLRILKMDAAGNELWHTNYGDAQGLCSATGVIQTADSGYFVLAYSSGSGGDLGVETQGFEDTWFLKLDQLGQLEWSRSYGGFGSDMPYAAVQTADGQLVVAAITASSNGDVVGYSGAKDGWALKLDITNGDIIWQNCLGSGDVDLVFGACAADDGGVVFSGSSPRGDAAEFTAVGCSQFWLIKLDENGVRQWQHLYGGSECDGGVQLCPAPEGGWFMIGSTTSNDGDVTGWHNGPDDQPDGWLVRLDANGGIIWQRAFGGIDPDTGVDVCPTSDGGCYTLGKAESGDGDVQGFGGGRDVWLIRWSAEGEIIWQWCLGGENTESPSAIAAVWDGGVVLCALDNFPALNGEMDCEGSQTWMARYPDQDFSTQMEEARSQAQPALTAEVAGGALQVRSSVPAANGYLQVIDQTGRIVMQQGVFGQSASVDLHHIACGAYLLVWSAGGEYAAVRFVRP